MIASLMMYLRPETAAANVRYWDLIRAALQRRGIAAPVTLSNDKDPLTVWSDAGLVLSQTCGMPYRLFLHDSVTLVGTPDFGVPGCPSGYYHSVAVVRKDAESSQLRDFRQARLAFNERHSQSGFAAAYSASRRASFWFENRLATGGHLASAKAVAEGRADIAFLDAVTWRLIERYEGFASLLRPLMQTECTPGLPYITALKDRATEIAAAVEEAITSLTPEDRDVLGLLGLVRIKPEDYLAIPNPPEDAG